jgi:alkanesulfonate monooxygenase SsuD/methylene tetrahydromethanopterin reductase-like flavin-dependent oxidoreductase (luciferase family)
MLKGGSSGGPLGAGHRNTNVEKAIEDGILFAGTPDQVYEQIKKFYNHIGGFGHLLNMGQAGFLEHDETVHGIQTFGREIYPRLKAEFPGTDISGFAAEVPLAAVS